MMRGTWFAGALLFLTAGALLVRLPDLGNRPFHGDESVHAFKFRDLWEKGVYRYDPNEFHGPTLYYAALPSVRLAGRRDFADLRESDLRAATAVFGAGMVLLLALPAGGLGRRAALVAAVLTAISPAFVFYSRYFIQETLLAFFTLAAIGCGWLYSQRRTAWWAAATGLCAGLMVATKETAVLSFGAAAVALWLTVAWTRRFAPPPPTSGESEERKDTSPSPRKRGEAENSLPACGEGRGGVIPARIPHESLGMGAPTIHAVGRGGVITRNHLAVALAVGLAVACLFLSGFFTNLSGPVDYLRAYTPWLRRAHATDLHRHPWFYYLSLLVWTHRMQGPVWSEGVIVLLAVVGFFAALLRQGAEKAGSHPGFARFIAFYTLLLTTAYSAIPYKTPWCVLSFLSGMILLAGIGAVFLLRAVPGWPLKTVVGLLLLAGAGQLAWLSYGTSFVYYTDGRNPYVYAQTVPDITDLAQRVEALAKAHPQHENMVIKVFSIDEYYYPLPWYLRRFPNVGYWTSVPQDADAPVALASPEFEGQLTQRLGRTHQSTGYYGLRPTALFEVWVRKDLWQAYLKTRPVSKVPRIGE
jgi:uncharacterized protein (TIGR03663 family)